ncbi:DNA-binding transcriptional regulator, MarR family [Streptomyces sp. AmelKG-D3]|nr:DNA-binding transcriptional regulator, MarR family [Streptomyces sp. AmelKG-D3]
MPDDAVRLGVCKPTELDQGCPSMGVEHSGPDKRLHDAARAMRGVIELLEVYWTRIPDGSSPVTVSAPQLRVLYVLEGREGINLRQLGTELAAAPSSVSRLCDRLEALGFVQRSSSAASRREVELRLTPQGRAHLDRLRARREERLALVLARIAPDARSRLADAVEVIRSALLMARAGGPAPGTGQQGRLGPHGRGRPERRVRETDDPPDSSRGQPARPAPDPGGKETHSYAPGDPEPHRTGRTGADPSPSGRRDGEAADHSRHDTGPSPGSAYPNTA